MKHRVLRGALVVYAAFALAPSAPSTILIRQDLADLLKNSEAVVRATIVGGEARWDAERRMIWTTTTFDVTETWKGTTTGRSSLRELGGVVGNVGMRVVGAPQYAAGEDVILFLYRDALGFTRTTGWTQGRLSVSGDPEKPGVALATALHDHVLKDYFVDSATRGALKVELASLKTAATSKTPPKRLVREDAGESK
jgi:hypothetical protein